MASRLPEATAHWEMEAGKCFRIGSHAYPAGPYVLLYRVTEVMAEVSSDTLYSKHTPGKTPQDAMKAADKEIRMIVSGSKMEGAALKLSMPLHHHGPNIPGDLNLSRSHGIDSFIPSVKDVGWMDTLYLRHIPGKMQQDAIKDVGWTDTLYLKHIPGETPLDAMKAADKEIRMIVGGSKMDGAALKLNKSLHHHGPNTSGDLNLQTAHPTDELAARKNREDDHACHDCNH